MVCAAFVRPSILALIGNSLAAFPSRSRLHRDRVPCGHGETGGLHEIAPYRNRRGDVHGDRRLRWCSESAGCCATLTSSSGDRHASSATPGGGEADTAAYRHG